MDELEYEIDRLLYQTLNTKKKVFIKLQNQYMHMISLRFKKMT
jgi:hypothetical protein